MITIINVGNKYNICFLGLYILILYKPFLIKMIIPKMHFTKVYKYIENKKYLKYENLKKDISQR
jgi:hypothetical protein